MSLQVQNVLISEAMEKAGNVGLGDRLQVFLPLLLDNLYSRWPWSFLTKRFTITVAAGTSELDFVSLVPNQRIYDVERVELGLNGNYIDDLDLKGPNEVAGFRDPAIQTGTGRSRPNTVVFDSTDPGNVKGFLFPIADQTYTLNFVIHCAPTSEFTYSAGSRVLYPNDLTVIEAMAAYVMGHMADEREFTFDAKVAALVTKDVAKWGMSSGQNRKWELNKKVFGQPAKRYITRWGWMGP